MSYLQIEIGGKLRGMKFSQGTNILLRDKVKDYSDAEKEAFGGYCIIWAALKANCVIKGEAADFTFEDVCDWCDKLSVEDYTKIIKLQTEVNAVVDAIEPLPDNSTEEEKKNVEEVISPIVTDLPAD
jgi:hypothetical protein